MGNRSVPKMGLQQVEVVFDYAVVYDYAEVVFDYADAMMTDYLARWLSSGVS